MTERMLQLGLDKEQKNKFGETPIVIAALHEATETVMFLKVIMQCRLSAGPTLRALTLHCFARFTVIGELGQVQCA